MALNPELVAPYGTNASSRRSTGLVPRLYQGEVIFASRPSCRLTTGISGTTLPSVWFGRAPSSPWTFSGAGTVYVTNYRLVFVAQKPTPEFQSIELPLLYIENFDVVQPIFGANYLHGNCQTDGTGTPKLNWRVAFVAGGMSTIVPLFYHTVAYIRTAASRRGQGTVPGDGGQETTKTKSVPPRWEVPEFVASAVVDPNDPTVVYVVAEQLGEEDNGPRPEADFDTLWTKKNQ